MSDEEDSAMIKFKSRTIEKEKEYIIKMRKLKERYSK